MTAIFETQDGTQYNIDDLQRKEKCDFCGKLGNISGEDGLIDGSLIGLTAEGHLGDRADACRECITKGINENDLDNEIGSEEEIKEELDEKDFV